MVDFVQSRFVFFSDQILKTIISVDLASVDRRNLDSEEETSERVKELTNVYANSELHKDVVYRIIEDTMKPTTGKQLLYQKYYQYRPQGSSFFRTLVTLSR